MAEEETTILQMHDLRPAPGAKKARTRVGRGEGSKGKTSGLNIYDTYLWLKSLAPNHLVIYEGAKGEWATDK